MTDPRSLQTGGAMYVRSRAIFTVPRLPLGRQVAALLFRKVEAWFEVSTVGDVPLGESLINARIDTIEHIPIVLQVGLEQELG